MSDIRWDGTRMNEKHFKLTSLKSLIRMTHHNNKINSSANGNV